MLPIKVTAGWLTPLMCFVLSGCRSTSDSDASPTADAAVDSSADSAGELALQITEAGRRFADLPTDEDWAQAVREHVPTEQELGAVACGGGRAPKFISGTCTLVSNEVPSYIVTGMGCAEANVLRTFTLQQGTSVAGANYSAYETDGVWQCTCVRRGIVIVHKVEELTPGCADDP